MERVDGYGVNEGLLPEKDEAVSFSHAPDTCDLPPNGRNFGTGYQVHSADSASRRQKRKSDQRRAAVQALMSASRAVLRRQRSRLSFTSVTPVGPPPCYLRGAQS
jgi:hypothetical protein